jgi:hypothetical protein
MSAFMRQLNTDMQKNSLREATSHSATQDFSQHFMEPEGSLPCPQDPTTGPYPKPDQSSPHHPILFL